MTAPIIGWGRPLGYTPENFHGITEHAGGSYVTACVGRFKDTDDHVYLDGAQRELDDRGRKMERCGACDGIAREQRTLAGLDELAAAPAMDFDYGGDF